MRVLIIKTSSLGDIIHTLPALTDAKKAYPNIHFDWVVEESFKELPAWHGAVQNVIPVALRRWRKQKWKGLKSGEMFNFFKSVRQHRYDYIIDAQGLLKSVMLMALCRSDLSIGFSWNSARESLASLFYGRRAEVSWDLHAVTRVRHLFAKAFNYALPEGIPDYGIDKKRLNPHHLNQRSFEKPYIVLLHGTTWDTKHWPESYWRRLAELLTSAGFGVQLLWGNAEEQNRANRIAADLPNAEVSRTKLNLGEITFMLAGARGVVSVDTGLGHLAAALNVPTVSLYGPTDPKATGTCGENQIHLTTQFSCSPCLNKICRYPIEKTVNPPCFETLPPEKVFNTLTEIVSVEKQ